MRNDVRVVEVVRQHEREGHATAEILAVLLAGDGERADVGQPARDQVRGSGGEHLLAVEVEQLDGARDAVAKTRAGEVPALDDPIERRNHGAEAVNVPSRELVVGGATPLGVRDTGQFLGVMWYNGEKTDETASQSHLGARLRR